jgi:hypothetical protein
MGVGYHVVFDSWFAQRHCTEWNRILFMSSEMKISHFVVKIRFTDLVVYMLLHGEYIVTSFKNFN